MNAKKLLFILLLMVLPGAYAESVCYDKNKDVAINFGNCQQAAKKNNEMAQYFLGQMYRKGEGVDKSLIKAERWYRKSAEQGNALAQYNLGWMYDMGIGVQKNVAETLKWYGQAAGQGDRYAPFNIGTMYYRGEGVDKDFVKTYYWFDIAKSNGNIKAKKWRDRIAERMTPEQLAAAQKMLEQWRTKTAASKKEAVD
jgi:TPR repeat protein